jgi:diadenosine tetraphosphate (Ap4A) HIT family hydrolase
MVDGRIKIPDIFKPKDGKFQLACKCVSSHAGVIQAKEHTLTYTADHHKIVVDDESYNYGHGHAYDFLGIDPSVGAAVTVRPDQHVSMITDLDDVQTIDHFFTGLLRSRVFELV